MEKGFASAWLWLLLVVVAFDKGQCIKCYMCSTLNDPNCHDPIASKMNPTECTSDLASSTFQRFRATFSGFHDISSFFGNLMQGGSFTCIKVDTVSPHSGGNSTIIRGCQFEKAPADDICKMLSAKAHGQSFLKFCELCDTDACNTADYVTRSSAFLSVILPLASILYFLHQ